MDHTLAQYKDKYLKLLQNLNEAFCIIDVIFDDAGKPYDYRFIETNPEFEKQTALTNVIGKTCRELIPSQEEYWFRIYGQVAETGKSVHFENIAAFVAGGVWFEVFAFKIGNPDDRHVAVLFNDITLQKRYEFLTGLSNQLAHIKTPGEIIKAACSKTAEYFNLSNCHFSDIDDAEDKGMVIYKWNKQETHALRSYTFRISELFIHDTIGLLHDGKMIIINDMVSDPRLKKSFFEAGRAYLISPVIKEGKLRYIFCISDDSPRAWRNHETELMKELTTLLWSRIERARAEEALHHIEINYRLKLENEIKHQTKELKDSRDFIESIAKITPDLITIHDATTNKLLYFNHANLWGEIIPDEDVASAEGTGRSLIIIHPSDLKKAEKFMGRRSLLADDEILEDEFQTLAGLKWGWVKTRSKVFKRDADGNASEIISFTTDITKRKLAEIEAIEKDEYIRKIEDTTPDVHYVYDIAEKKINYINKDILPVIGFTPEVINDMGKYAMKYIFHRDDYKVLFNEAMLPLKPGEILERELRVKDVKGHWRWYKVRHTFFRAGEDGRPKQIMGICQDITNEKETQILFNKEKTRSGELRRLNALLDTFVFAAAHDLKGPVSNIRLLTSVIASAEDNNRKLKLLNMYSPIVENLDRTLSGLISVLEIEKESVKEKELILQDICDSVIKELNSEMQAGAPLINVDFSSCEAITFNESYLLSIFRNMISNSLKYRSEKRDLIIDIRSKPAGRYVLLDFRDNGIGIDLDRYRKDVFKPFWRLNSKSDGSGIGLHIVKSIVARNGGKIRVESSLEKGTIFRIYLLNHKKL